MSSLNNPLTYNEVVSAIQNYYGGSISGGITWSEVSQAMARGGVTTDNYLDIVESYPNLFNVTKNYDGSIRNVTINPYASYTYDSAQGSITELNSNVAGSVMEKSAKLNVPNILTKTSTTGSFELSSGIGLTADTGVTAIGVASTVGTALTAVNIGCALGKTVDSVLYNANPDFWDSIGLSTLNPETWDSITSDSGDGLGTRVVNTLLRLNSDGTTTQYMDETALAYFALAMQNAGVFADSPKVITKPDDFPSEIDNFLPFNVTSLPVTFVNSSGKTTSAPPADLLPFSPISGGLWCDEMDGHNGLAYRYFAYSANKTAKTYSYTYNGKTVYYKSGTGGYTSFQPIGASGSVNTPLKEVQKYGGYLAWLALYNSVSGGIEGIGTQVGATTPNLDGLTTVDDVLNALKTQYPELWDKAITNTVPQSDGTDKTYIYIPVPSATGNTTTDTQPTTGDATQSDPDVDPDTAPQDLIDLITSLINLDGTDIDTPDTGTGDTPTVTTPMGSASALYKIYNPTQGELNSFGAWLWSSDFVDQLLKLFNDPMQAIIGLHKVFCPVPVGGTANIKVGYLDSGVSSNYVSDQYTTINCGSVSLPEYFGNVFDYDPFTKVFIYLPFIGIEQLNTGDVMRSTISVTYHCDVLTGACLAEINVSRDNRGGILYTYTGNCAVQYPISSGSYMGIVESMAGIGASIVGTVASGGSLAPVALGAMGAGMNAHTTVSHSGAFSGNAGAMGVKTPYLIITRPQTALAKTFPALDGYPANYSTTVGSCSGYIEIESVHVENVPATDGELSEIEMLLKSGVIV